MKWCRECGAQLEDDQKYCSECGAGQVETEAETNRENIVNRPSGERKKRNIPPILIILLIGMVIITGAIFLLEYKSNGSGGRGSKESVISAVSTEEKETSTQSQKADDKNETEEEKEVESEADQEIESTDNTEKDEKLIEKMVVLPVDSVAICLLYLLLRSHTNCYQNTMTGLLRQLVQTAEHMGMDPCQIPATPRMLGIRLEMLEPGLEKMLGARLTICCVNDVPRSVRIIIS